MGKNNGFLQLIATFGAVTAAIMMVKNNKMLSQWINQPMQQAGKAVESVTSAFSPQG
ncbi:hypothetical protein [Sporolactobacillus spathodeae]|uniref:Uncharacterized protein n=1 Tax=Sporolactobacillus spathodeae TaxID=1465502 RepID=A0ABS2QAW7_9BACL|nr:hypothetical protein [Sporolactobacillus spathodeae]MBM7658873.1 hypothetical protein [Sporolactobacillus spathodeae]